MNVETPGARTESPGAEIVSRINELGRISEAPDALTRLYLSAEHKRAADLIMGWLTEAGMSARLDAVGNVIGRYEATRPGQPALLLGSHYDTVRDAGRWDGPLGLITAIACVANLRRRDKRLPFAIEVMGFADEEGVRFPAALIGSRGVAGTLADGCLDLPDASGVRMSEAMTAFGLDPRRIRGAGRRRDEFVGYIEMHIEQGPVLEAEGLPVGIVSAISGATRLAVTLNGVAGHAGTVPMPLRRDALAGAAECIAAVEEHCRTNDDLVGTVGSIQAEPGATNVIPGRVTFSIDLRSASDSQRRSAVAAITGRIEQIAATRNLRLQVDVTHESRTVPCDPQIRRQIAEAIKGEKHRVLELPSGAGHDGMAIADIADIGMIFVRCRGGISHNPAEHVEHEDVEAGARVLMSVIENFQPSVKPQPL